MALWQDFRFALRILRKNLGVTVLAVSSLALAIAGNTTVYSLINSFVNRPLPYRQVERLELIGERSSDALAGQIVTTSPANYLDFVQRQKAFTKIAAFQGAVSSLDSASDEPEQLTTGAVTPGFFALLGTVPIWGRSFAREEAVRGGAHVVVLGNAFWHQRFGGRVDLSGESLELNGEHYSIIGVLPADFEWLLAANTEIWIPLVLERATAARNRRNLFAIGRLRDGVKETVAQAEMDTLMEQLTQEYPDANRGFTVELLNMRTEIPDARNRLFMTIMQVALLFVLLIACANVANLLLARSQAREREIAVRASLGARRERIVRQLLTESMVTATIAGILGVALGYAGLRLVGNAFAGLLPSFWMPRLDLHVLTYSLGVTLLGGVLFGLAPVLQTGRFDLLPALKDGTQGATSSGRRKLASNLLVVAEIGCALAFLAGSSMMIHTFQTMQTADAGFATTRLLVMRVDLPDVRYDTAEKQVAGVRQITAQLAAAPGVRSLAVSNLSPRTPFVPEEAFEIAGRPAGKDDVLPRASWLSCGPDFFRTLGIQAHSGRLFTDADSLDAPRVVVINQAMAARYWPQQDPIGDFLTFQGERREIIGVVPTVRHDLFVRAEPSRVVYLPWLQRPAGAFGLTLEALSDPSSLAGQARRTLAGIDRSIALTQVQSLDAFVEQFWIGQRVFTALLGGFGLLALVLATIGTYGVLAYSVAQRTHEIGIRMAIGADRAQVMRLIVQRGLLLAGLGIALGIPLVVIQIRLISAVFAGLVPVEPISVFGVGILLAAVTTAASAIPAHRAASIDPMRALRCA